MIVAAIQEILRTTSKNVLVCAQSNGACDELTLRLLKVLKKNQLIRVYDYKSCAKSIDDTILENSNFNNNKFEFPSFEYLYQFRVVVCTLSTAGHMTRARCDTHFNSSHFGFTFIDEAAVVPESATLVPIAGISSDWKQIKTRIVLAGDWNQSGTVVKSNYASMLGYKISLMKHLSHHKCYAKGGKFIAKLS